MRGSVAALLVALALITSGCSGSVDADTVRTASGPVPGVSVAGTPGEAPSVRIVAPLRLTGATSAVVVTGTGEPVRVDQLVVLHLTLYNARTGTKALSTYDEPAAPIVVKGADGSLFGALDRELVGLPQGTRLAMAVPGAEAFANGGTPPDGVRREDPVVVVADVVAVPPELVLGTAQGVPRPVPAGRPEVVLDGTDPVRLDFGTAAEPDELVVVPLIAGTGPPVRNQGLVTLDVLAQAWGTRLPFEDTYFKEPVVHSIGTTTSVPAWDSALVGLRRGSRMLVIAPAAQGRVPPAAGVPEHATIAWVIDILGVS